MVNMKQMRTEGGGGGGTTKAINFISNGYRYFLHFCHFNLPRFEDLFDFLVKFLTSRVDPHFLPKAGNLKKK